MLRMIHAVVGHLSGMILLHQFYHYLRVASIQKEALNTVKNTRPSSSITTLPCMDENRRNQRYLVLRWVQYCVRTVSCAKSSIAWSYGDLFCTMQKRSVARNKKSKKHIKYIVIFVLLWYWNGYWFKLRSFLGIRKCQALHMPIRELV